MEQVRRRGKAADIDHHDRGMRRAPESSATPSLTRVIPTQVIPPPHSHPALHPDRTHTPPSFSFFDSAASVTSLTSLVPSCSTCSLKMSATGSRPLGTRWNRRNMRARSSV